MVRESSSKHDLSHDNSIPFLQVGDINEVQKKAEEIAKSVA